MLSYMPFVFVRISWQKSKVWEDKWGEEWQSSKQGIRVTQ